jgi:hypothetical protein
METNKLYQGDTQIRGDKFDFDNFRRFLHYPAGRVLPESITGFLDSSLLPSLDGTHVAYQYKIVPVISRDIRQHKIELPAKKYFQGPLIYNLLKNCDQVVVHILSLQGVNFEDDWQSFISYCFSNTLIQTSSDELRRQILEHLQIPSEQLTQRYAPGYCGWPLTDQEILLNILKPESIGVTRAINSFALQPEQTITGVYGIRNEAQIRENMPCYTCTSISCGVHFDFIKEIK